MISDFREGRFVFIMKVLRDVTDYGLHVDFIVAADFRARANISAGMKDIVAADFDIVFNDDMGADGIADTDFDVFTDDGAWMDCRHGADSNTELSLCLLASTVVLANRVD